ncbi:MAG: 2-deoxyribose-5-phosphate aldolase, partial [Fervidobacterium sp.]
TDEEKIVVSFLSKLARAAFVKTSTGFGTSGAKFEDVQLMRWAVDGEIEIKASGGIKTYEDALKMITAGATRIGTSSGVSIVKR